MFALDTLEVACNPGIASFGLTERKPPNMWRWAVVDAKGLITDEGWEPTQMDAKRSAVDALQHVVAR